MENDRRCSTLVNKWIIFNIILLKIIEPSFVLLLLCTYTLKANFSLLFEVTLKQNCIEKISLSSINFRIFFFILWKINIRWTLVIFIVNYESCIVLKIYQLLRSVSIISSVHKNHSSFECPTNQKAVFWNLWWILRTDIMRESDF